MPIYSYEAAGKDGKPTHGTIEAPSRSMAVERLLQQGRTPLQLSEQPLQRGPASLSAWLPSWGSMAEARSRGTLLRELAILLKAGLNVERSLTTMAALASTPATRATIDAMLESLRSGETLSAAMARAGDAFPESMRRLVAAGEASGRLPEVMTRIADAEERTRQLSDRLVSAMIYPALLMVTMLGVLTLIFTSVLPQLEPVLASAGSAIPWPAAMLLAVSRFMNAFGFTLAVVLLAGLVASLYLLRQPATQLALDRHAIKARYLLGIPLHYQTAQFFRNLAMLVDGGMPLNRALELAQQALSNRFMRQALDAVINDVRQGRTLRTALEQAGLFPRLAVEFVAVGEETGRLAPMLQEAADMFERDVQTRVDRLSALLLPMMTIFLGLVVAAIMTGVVSGIFAANDLAIGP
ncbi:MAG: type II secretion system F family protein [Alphaproteobacteria bacterium]